MTRNVTMKKLFAPMLFLLFGCMQPAGNDASLSTQDTGIQDPDLLAGASSSTNWPSEDAGDSTRLSIAGRADSILVLHFSNYRISERISGRVSLFPEGRIPALDSIPVLSFPFQNADSMVFLPEQFSRMQKGNSDSVLFTLRIETDTAQCLMIGFHYSRSRKTFLNSPFSRHPDTFFPLLRPKYSYKGMVDSSLFNFGGYSEGKMEWCFYIPGSPYFWKIGFDSIVEIGPIPGGTYPLRLLRISHPDGDTKRNQLEVYEVLIEPSAVMPGQNTRLPTLSLGERLFTSPSAASLSIRSGTP